MRKHASLWLILTAALAVAIFGTVLADNGGRPFTTTLTGAAEVPGPGDPDGSSTADVAGPIVVHLMPPTNGSSSGCTTADRELILAIIQHPEQCYVNVHNAEFPPGALREQLSR